MSDIIDQTEERSQVLIDKQIDFLRNLAAKIPEGRAGECVCCGEFSQRIVKSWCPVNHDYFEACPPCRDRRHLK